MTEALLAMMTAGICALILSMGMKSAGDLMKTDIQTQNGLGLLQLRYRAALATTARCEENELVLVRNHQEFRYLYHNERIVQTPGYEILLEPVREGRFVCEGSQVYLETETQRWQVR